MYCCPIRKFNGLFEGLHGNRKTQKSEISKPFKFPHLGLLYVTKCLFRKLDAENSCLTCYCLLVQQYTYSAICLLKRQMKNAKKNYFVWSFPQKWSDKQVLFTSSFLMFSFLDEFSKFLNERIPRLLNQLYGDFLIVWSKNYAVFLFHAIFGPWALHNWAKKLSFSSLRQWPPKRRRTSQKLFANIRIFTKIPISLVAREIRLSFFIKWWNGYFVSCLITFIWKRKIFKFHSYRHSDVMSRFKLLLKYKFKLTKHKKKLFLMNLIFYTEKMRIFYQWIQATRRKKVLN